MTYGRTSALFANQKRIDSAAAALTLFSALTSEWLPGVEQQQLPRMRDFQTIEHLSQYGRPM
jgi:hypothetical protein